MDLGERGLKLSFFFLQFKKRKKKKGKYIQDKVGFLLLLLLFLVEVVLKST